ncbi:MAG: MFS transporter [Alphaproteobacteria bacterium]|nr:MFS transporter [Alphaproteobacteria bacterium]
MAAQSTDALLAMFDRAPLNRRYWTSFGLLSAITVLDFFDFFLIAFILSKIGPEWKLTYGQSGLILYGGGIGAIAGALVWGALADVLGRKMQIITGTLICAISAGLIGTLPTGAWVWLAVLRILVGFGLAAAATPCTTIVVELTPTRWRTLMTSLYVVFATGGTFLASIVSASLFTALGWRGLALLGIAPAIIGLFVWLFVGESVRWLAVKGRFAEARAEVARHLGVPLDTVPLPTYVASAPPSASLRELYSNPRLFWQTVIIWAGSSTAVYGYYLWGPTIVAMVLNVGVGVAAGYFVYVSGAAITGKLLISFIAPITGRRRIGIVFGFIASACLTLAALYHDALVGGFPLMIILISAAAFFCEGGFSNLAPYTVEQYGVRLGARSSGLGQAANGVGKVLGPLALAVIAGSSNLVTPQASSQAVTPAFLFLAAGMLLVTGAFIFLGVETHGRAMEDIAAETTGRKQALAAGAGAE